jgi:hypothetical protein
MRWLAVDNDLFGGAAARHRRTFAVRVLLFLLAPVAIAFSLLSSHGSAAGAPQQQMLGSDAKALVNATGGESLLRYAIGCALPADASVSTDDGTQFTGSLGLAPQWAERPLDPSEQRWISACLLARTNLFGVHVTISMRGKRPTLSGAVTEEERTNHAFEEGAFYGDLWAQPSRAYVCTGTGENAVKDRLQRVCTEESDVAGVSRCGFEIAGRCEDVCENEGSDGAKLRCRGGETTYDEVITIFLKSQ